MAIAMTAAAAGALGAQCAPMERADSAEPNATGDPDSDEALMQAYARGDVAAFARLYDRHEGGVYRFIARCVVHLSGSGVVDELHQDVWFSVTRQASRYEPSARFTTWLYTIARHRVIDHVRQLKPTQGPLQSLDDEHGTELAEHLAADAANEPLQQVQTRQQAQAFLAAIDDLPPDQREAFLLQAEAGMSLEDIASATGVGAETAKSRLRYARNKLRQALAAWL
jgi:RNA polymerase sigma factor (sigma-70 family)